LWTVFATILSGLAAAYLVIIVAGQAMTAPEWLRDRVATRIEQNLGDLQISFGDIEMVVNRGWRPRVHLQDLVLSRPDGQALLQLSDAEASLSMRALMRGQFHPKNILLNGMFVTLQRGADGAVALSLGDVATPLERAPGMAQLVGTLDSVLESPLLQALQRAELDALTVRYEDLGSGRAWTVDGGRVEMARTKGELTVSGSFSLLSGRDYASTLELNYASTIGQTEAEFGFVVADIAAQDIAAQSVALRWLEPLRAPISGALRGGIDGNGAVGPLSATLQIGSGVLQPTDQTRPIPFDGARTYFTYQPESQTLVFDEISLSSGWFSGVAEGEAQLGGTKGGTLTDLIGQFSLRDLRFDPDGLYDKPLELALADTDFRLELDPFRLTLGQMQIVDGASTLHLSGALSAENDGWDLTLDGLIDQLTPERLVELWPERAAPRPRKWVAKNLNGGDLNDLNFALRVHPSGPPDVYVDFGFSGSSIGFIKTLPPISEASGFATLIDRRFVATATAGQLSSAAHGSLDVTGTSFIIPDVSMRPNGFGIARVQAQGPVAAIMALLNRPPLSILKNTSFPVDLADGTVRAIGSFNVPLAKKVRFEDVTFHVNGQIDQVGSNVLLPGQVLSSDRLQVQVDHTQVVISGPGRVDDLPVQVSWRQPIGKGVPRASRLTGQVELSERLIETFNIGLPPGSVTGQGSADFTLDFRPGLPPALVLTSDLEGAVLKIPSLSWSKPAATGGALTLASTLGARPGIDRFELKAAGLEASGKITTRDDGGLDRATFSSVRLGGWLDTQAVLIGRGKGVAPELQVTGGQMDMRRAAFGIGGQGDTGAMKIALNRLQITDTLALTGFVGEFSVTTGLRGAFRGNLNGSTPVTGDVVPQGGRSAFRINSADAGGVFRDAGLLKQGRDGNLALTLVPVDEPGIYNGQLKVRNIRVKDAPAIAALLNAASIVGLLDEMTGSGILFTQVDARFRLTPSQILLYESSAVGPSIGLSMDGIYDVVSERFGMQGVISPIYLINGIGSVLTRKGEGVIGFNYTLRGTASDPAVQVNPLSALTPGMLREVFRTAPPSDPNAPEPERRRARSPDISDGSTGGR